MSRTTLSAIILLGAGAVATADIVAIGGGVSHVPAPYAATPDAYTDPVIHAWDERQGIALDIPLIVNATMPGTYDTIADLTPGAIASGTTVSSHYIHFDTPGTEVLVLSGWVTFDAPILGVIVAGDVPGWNLLDASDFLGAPGTMYPDALMYRGLEFANGIDAFSISADRMTLIIDQFRVAHPGDHVRIITETLPTPGTITLAGLGGLLAMKRRRR